MSLSHKLYSKLDHINFDLINNDPTHLFNDISSPKIILTVMSPCKLHISILHEVVYS